MKVFSVKPFGAAEWLIVSEAIFHAMLNNDGIDIKDIEYNTQFHGKTMEFEISYHQPNSWS